MQGVSGRSLRLAMPPGKRSVDLSSPLGLRIAASPRQGAALAVPGTIDVPRLPPPLAFRLLVVQHTPHRTIITVGLRIKDKRRLVLLLLVIAGQLGPLGCRHRLPRSLALAGLPSCGDGDSTGASPAGTFHLSRPYPSAALGPLDSGGIPKFSETFFPELARIRSWSAGLYSGFALAG